MINNEQTTGMQPIAVSERSETSPSRSPSGTWAHWLALLLVLIAGVSLREVCLACKPFWFDECFSVVVARSQHVVVLPLVADVASFRAESVFCSFPFCGDFRDHIARHLLGRPTS